MGMDDSLDVIGVHLVSGIVGTVALGFVALPSEGTAGLFYGGGFGLLLTQVVAVLVSVVYCAVLTFVIAFVIDKTIGFRITERDEIDGIDITQHAESGYALAGDATGSFSPGRHAAGEDASSFEPGRSEPVHS
jgi:Amt family ammonium transporter